MKERRARDAVLAMRERDAKRAATLANTARLRALRLAKEAEVGNAVTKKTSPRKKAT